VPFSNEITGANGGLVRNWIQSPNYIAGSTGWRISKDGSAEFNNGTFRGSIEVGSLAGQHFWVNNPNTGDVIDVYNAANQLVFSIDTNGRLVSNSSVSTSNIVMVAASLFFEDSAQNPQLPPQLAGIITATETDLTINGGVPQNAVGGTQPPFIQFAGQLTSATGYIRAGQRNVQGSLMQTDGTNGSGSNNQLVHIGAYNVATDAAGSGTFNHGAGFTPMAGFLAGVNGIGANFPYQYAWFTSPFTATTAKAAFKDNFGAALASTTLGVFGIFFG